MLLVVAVVPGCHVFLKLGCVDEITSCRTTTPGFKTDAIKSLIDELCDKLNAEPAESTEPLLPSLVAYSSQELAEQYYSTFPSLPTPVWTTKFSEKEEGQESRTGYKMDAVNKPFINKESIEMDQEPVHFDRIIRRPSRDSSYVNDHTKSIVKNVLSFLDISDEALEKNYTRHDHKYKHKNYALRDEYKNNVFRDEHKNEALRKEKHDLFSICNPPSYYDPYSLWAARYKYYGHRDGEQKDAPKSEKHDLLSVFNPGEHKDDKSENHDLLLVFNPIVGSHPGSIWGDENKIHTRICSKYGKHENDTHRSGKHHSSFNYNPLLGPPYQLQFRNNAPSCEGINRDGKRNDARKSEKHDLFSVFNPVVGSDPGSIWADENEILIKDDSKHRKHKNDAHMSEKHHPFSNYNPLLDNELHSIMAARWEKIGNNAPSRERINRDEEHNDARKSEKHDLFSEFDPVVGSERYSVWADESKTRKKDDSKHGKHKNYDHMSEEHLFSEYSPLLDSELHLMLAAMKGEGRSYGCSIEMLLQAGRYIHRRDELMAQTFNDGKWNYSFPPASSASSLEKNKGMDYDPMCSCFGDLCMKDSEHNVFRSWWEGFEKRIKRKNTDRAYDVISLSDSLFQLNHDDEGPFIIASLSNSPRTEHENGSDPAKTATSTKSALDRSDYKFLESLDTNFIPIEVQEKRDRENEIDISESDEDSSGDEQTGGGYPRGSSLSTKVPPELLKSFTSKSKFYRSNKCCQAEVEEHVVLMVCITDDAEDCTNETFVETDTSSSQEQRKESLDYRNCADWSMWGIGRSNLFSDKEAGEDAREIAEEDLEWDNNTLRNLWNLGNLMANSQACEICPDRVRRNLFWEGEIEPQDHDSDWQELSCALDREITKLQRESPIDGVRMYQLFGPSSKRNMKILKESTCLPASSSFFEENCITQMPTLHTVTL